MKMALNTELLLAYFPRLTPLQLEKFNTYHLYLSDWNKKINLISENDLPEFTLRHLLPSLSVTKVLNFRQGLDVLDLGTGGGLPGIPLAILMEKVNFTLVDSVGKKVNIVADISRQLGLKNVTAIKSRGEELNKKFHIILTRAAVKINSSITWLNKLIYPEIKPLLEKGTIYFKGGNLSEELKNVKNPYTILSLHDFYKEDYFNEKVLVYFKKQEK